MRQQLQILFFSLNFLIICCFFIFFDVHKLFLDNYSDGIPALHVTDDKSLLRLEIVHALELMD
jgi:hypothetical protein